MGRVVLASLLKVIEKNPELMEVLVNWLVRLLAQELKEQASAPKAE